MSCYRPIPAVDFGSKLNKDGVVVRNIKLVDIQHKFFGCGLDEIKAHYGDNLILLPCGHCIGCAHDYAKKWSSRIMLEASKYKHNCFVTLTYADCFLPDKPIKRDLQLFIKRLRKVLDCKIRYFACGEIGEKKGSREINPHYHIIIFNYDFPDKVFLKRSSSGMVIYRSPLLEKLWTYGLSSIGDVSPESSQYVAKYSMKRMLNNVDYGEFVLMSRKPGIGLNGFSVDIYETDKLYVYGHQYSIPRYFDKQLEKNNPELFADVKASRIERARKIPSKKFRFNMSREEFSLRKLELDTIRKDVLKVRNI